MSEVPRVSSFQSPGHRLAMGSLGFTKMLHLTSSHSSRISSFTMSSISLQDTKRPQLSVSESREWKKSRDEEASDTSAGNGKRAGAEVASSLVHEGDELHFGTAENGKAEKSTTLQKQEQEEGTRG